MTYPSRWSNKIPAGRPWHSPDGTTSAWRVGGSEYRIQTTDPARAGRLGRLSRVQEVGRAVVGGPLYLFRLDGRKMNGKAVRVVLNGAGIGTIFGPNLTPAMLGSPA